MKTKINQIDINQIDKVGEISTEDISLKDKKLLDEGKGNCLYENDYGYLIYTPQDNIENFFEEIKKEGFSKFFVAILKYAVEKNLRYLRIDSDAKRIFPKWERIKLEKNGKLSKGAGCSTRNLQESNQKNEAQTKEGFQEISVPIEFKGYVKIKVLKNADNPKKLAECIALARITADEELNPNSEESGLETYLETLKEKTKGEEDWEETEFLGVIGSWTTNNLQNQERNKTRKQ